MRFTLALILVACTGGAKDDDTTDTGGTTATGSGWPYCAETLTPLGWEEAAPDGTVPGEALAPFEGEHVVVLAYEDGGETALTIRVTRAGEPEWVDQEAVYPGTGPAIGVVCWDHVRMPVAARFTTEDGAFAESWEQTHSAPGAPYSTDDSGLALSYTVDPAMVAGSWTLEGVDPSGYDFLELAIAGSTGSGTVVVNGQRTTGDAVSFGIVQEVGTWGR